MTTIRNIFIIPCDFPPALQEDDAGIPTYEELAAKVDALCEKKQVRFDIQYDPGKENRIPMHEKFSLDHTMKVINFYRHYPDRAKRHIESALKSRRILKKHKQLLLQLTSHGK